MTQYNIYEAKTNLSKIVKSLENYEEETIYISRNGKSIVKLTRVEECDRSGIFGCAKGQFVVPDNFDDLDVSEDFEDLI